MSSVKIPPAVRASWPKPDYINPPSQAHIMIGAETALIVITTIIIGLRMYTRSFLTTGRINLDDWLMVVALIFSIATTILNLVAVNYGWGLHIYDVPYNLIEGTQKIAFTTELIFIYCVCFTKLSILAFYLRIFGTYKTLRVLSIIGICYVVSWTFIFTIVVVCQCIPVRAFWDSTVKNPTCINSFAANMSAPILNSVSDVYLFLIPIKWVWDLQLPKRQRAALVFAFGLGLIVVIAGFIRLHFLRVLLGETYDITWDGVTVYIATSVEGNVGIICASIPALKPMFVRMFPSLRRTNTSTNRSYKLRDVEELEIVSPQTTRVKTQSRYAADEISL